MQLNCYLVSVCLTIIRCFDGIAIDVIILLHGVSKVERHNTLQSNYAAYIISYDLSFVFMSNHLVTLKRSINVFIQLRDLSGFGITTYGVMTLISISYDMEVITSEVVTPNPLKFLKSPVHGYTCGNGYIEQLKLLLLMVTVI